MFFGAYAITLLILFIVIIMARVIAQPWIDFSYAYYYELTKYPRERASSLLLFGLVLLVIAFFVFLLLEAFFIYAFKGQNKHLTINNFTL